MSAASADQTLSKFLTTTEQLSAEEISLLREYRDLVDIEREWRARRENRSTP